MVHHWIVASLTKPMGRVLFQSSSKLPSSSSPFLDNMPSPRLNEYGVSQRQSSSCHPGYSSYKGSFTRPVHSQMTSTRPETSLVVLACWPPTHKSFNFGRLASTTAPVTSILSISRCISARPALLPVGPSNALPLNQASR